MPKILVADDSKTIQKVIRITLDTLKYEIIECNSEKDLFNLIGGIKVDLILLDFNLAEGKPKGYDIAQKIYGKIPEVKIVMMFGAFDPVDDQELFENKIHEKIIKPFEGHELVKICNEILPPNIEDDFYPNVDDNSFHDDSDSSMHDENTSIIEEVPDDLFDKSVETQISINPLDEESIDEENGWEIGQSSNKLEPQLGEKSTNSPSLEETIDPPTKKSDSIEFKQSNFVNEEVIDSQKESFDDMQKNEYLKSLEREIKSWGLAVPKRLNNDESYTDIYLRSFPPLIKEKELEQENNDLSEQKNISESKEQIIQENIQAGPDIIFDNIISDSNTDDEEEGTLPNEDDLEYPGMEDYPEGPIQETNNITISEDFKGPIANLDSTLSFNYQEYDKKHVSQLKEQIEDETDDTLWQVDSDDSAKAEKNSSEDSLSSLMSEKEVNKIIEKLTLELKENLSNDLQQIFEQSLQKLCLTTIEKVAWEVIPDLAENLVKKELDRMVEETKSDVDK